MQKCSFLRREYHTNKNVRFYERKTPLRATPLTVDFEKILSNTHYITLKFRSEKLLYLGLE